MNKIRVTASQAARRFVAHEHVSRLLCLLNGRTRIVMLHGVGTPEYPANVFRDQLSFLKQVFQLVSLEQVLHKEQSQNGSRPKLALTFDDGLKNNFSHAYPVLRELGAPATFFVCPGLIDSGRWLWNHECRARLSRLAGEERRALAATLGLTSYGLEDIVTKLKYMPHLERIAHEKRLRELTPSFERTEAERLMYDLMTWSDLRSLDPELIEIGGHSTHHEILTRVAPVDLDREVGDCRRLIERELQRPVRHFCYPDGAHDARVVECVGRYFEAAVTTEKASVPPQPAPLRLPRIPVGFTVADLAWRMHRPTG